ncbi:MAG: Hsp33 family molecular chaperone HslO [Polyangiaceae bacterium]
MGAPGDSVLRAITNDGAFRVVVAETTRTVRDAVAAQHATPATARQFGDLLTGAVLFRETMAPSLRVQTVLRGVGGRGSLVADSHPSGMTRGLIQLPEGSDSVDTGAGALLQLMRTLPRGRINQGVVEIPEGGDVSHAMMAYMQTSEQVVSMVAVATLLEAGEVRAAGGYLVQLLPEVGRGPLLVMTERLRDFENIESHVLDAEFSPSWLLEQLLHGMEYTELERSQIGFDCWCDELRLLSVLSTVDRADLEDLLAQGEPLEITCDYCRKEYRIAPAKLRGLMGQSS